MHGDFAALGLRGVGESRKRREMSREGIQFLLVGVQQTPVLVLEAQSPWE